MDSSSPAHSTDRGRSARRRVISLALVVSAALALAACAPQADPVASNEVLAPGDEAATVILTDRDRAAALDAMRSVVSGPVELPAPARYGVRWRDIGEAARLAASDLDMAVVRRRDNDAAGQVTFELVTTRDEPATLVVTREPPPEIVRASATVGSFGQRPEDASRLVESFMTYLRAFGSKPGFE